MNCMMKYSEAKNLDWKEKSEELSLPAIRMARNISLATSVIFLTPLACCCLRTQRYLFCGKDKGRMQKLLERNL